MADGTEQSVVQVKPWPGEEGWFVLVLVLSAMIWLALAMSIIGFVYVLFIGLFLFFSHLALITHIRGSGVRLGPDQFPELHRRVEELSARVGMPPPAAYLMQQGGALNAFATKFFRSKIIVLYSDLLEACDEDAAARDMVIGHELGHVRAGHLNWLWILTPGMLIPFLGAAYSRARERTCDRYGQALCGDPQGALRGLAILAAGGKHGPRVNLEAMVDQRADLTGGWMTLGKWLSFYPTLAERIAALEPRLQERPVAGSRGPVLACGLLLLIFALPIAGITGFFAVAFSNLQEAIEEIESGVADVATDSETEAPVAWTPEEIEAASNRASADAEVLASGVRRLHSETGSPPADIEIVYLAWPEWYPDTVAPLDPFDGLRFGYERLEGGFTIWSSGADGSPQTDDDLVFEFDD